MRLMIIDDDPMFRAFVQAIFAGAGDEVLLAASGAEALGYAGGHGAHPDIVLLDLSMPGESGLEILPRLRATPGWEAIPVLMLTADDNLENLVRAARRGARGYVCKPVQPDMLISMVKDVLGDRDLEWIDDYSKVQRAAG